MCDCDRVISRYYGTTTCDYSITIRCDCDYGITALRCDCDTTDGCLAQGSSQTDYPASDGGYPATDSGTSMGHDSYGDVEYGKIYDIYFPTVSGLRSTARRAPRPCV